MMVHRAWPFLGVHAQLDHFFPKRMNKTSRQATRTYGTKQLVFPNPPLFGYKKNGGTGLQDHGVPVIACGHHSS
jgi:hypothetical protein